MLVDRSKLVQYSIASDLWFSRRSGEGNPISRNEFFNRNPARLTTALYCAIGSDAAGWELEMFNGVNWVVITPDTTYTLIITNNGLKALSNIKRGGMQLYFSGLKIINNTVLNPASPIITWTDNNLLEAGEVVFACGCTGTNIEAPDGELYLNKILSWRYNDSSGGLQYIVSLPAEGYGSEADDGSTDWEIGAIGLYVKDPLDNTTDVLFAVATLPEVVIKHATTTKRVGSSLKLYFNTILTNLGIVANVDVMKEADVSLPEVANETLLLYSPDDAKKKPYNCYIIDNYNGTNTPAIAVQRKTTPATMAEYNVNNDWVLFTPTDTSMNFDPNAFDSNVRNYDLVYWDSTANKYKRAQGIELPTQSGAINDKQPIGLRVGNSIISTGIVVNTTEAYQYNVTLSAGGANYAAGDELLIPGVSNLIFKVAVLSVNANGAIEQFQFINPTIGDTAIPDGVIILNAIYDTHSQIPRNGTGARFTVTSTPQPKYQWNFPSTMWNKPIYCDTSARPGQITATETDSMVGWCLGKNIIQLGLDLRSEATTDRCGIMQFATDDQVRRVSANEGVSTRRAVCPKYLKNNYLQISKPNATGTYTSGDGSSLSTPILVDTFVKFNQIVLGKKATSPYDSTSSNPNVTNADLDFYGCSYRAWYADIAEFYESDELYEPGTLVYFGGAKEITIASEECEAIISTKPGFQLGNKLSDLHLPVALVGRVPVRFDGNCMPKTGDKIYLSKIKKGCASTVPNGKCLGKIIEKKIGTSKLIECIVRIDF